MTTLLLDRPFSEQQLAESPELDLRNIGAGVWTKMTATCRATDLRLYHITTGTLAGIESLVNTRRLVLEWATKIDTLTPVFQLNRLTSLSVFDFSKLRHISGVETLSELTELNLSGNQGSLIPPLRLASIEPVTRIASLTHFSLTNAKLDDDDITVLARCQNLRHLHLSNQFERSQMAFLAKRLNEQLATPLVSHIDTRLKCEKCNGYKSMFTGRRMPMICQACDKSRFQRYVSEFDQLVRNA